jgi:ParB-like chromosome segregation protein Spo0J
MHVEDKPLSELKPSSRNARRHPRKQLRKLATSLRRYGCRTPLLIEGDGTIIAGHGRLEAARLAGLTTLPVVLNAFGSDSDKRAYMLADNRLAEEATLPCQRQFRYRPDGLRHP